MTNISKVLMLGILLLVFHDGIWSMELKLTKGSKEKKELVEDVGGQATQASDYHMLSGFKRAYYCICSSPDFEKISLINSDKKQLQVGMSSLFQMSARALLDKRDERGNSFLHYAAARGDLEFAKKFIRMGFPVDEKNGAGETPYAIAYAIMQAIAEKNNEEINKEEMNKMDNMQYLLKTHKELLRVVKYYDNKWLVESLLKKEGVYVNVRNQAGDTPLLIAAWHGTQYIVKLLLTKGAFVNVQNNEGQTALHLATWCGYEEIVQYLLEARADTTIKNKDGKTALEIARARRLQFYQEDPYGHRAEDCTKIITRLEKQSS